MIFDADVIEHAAESAESDAHPIGATKAAELATALEMRFEIDDDAWNAAFLQLLLKLRNRFGEIAKDPFVAAVAQIGGHEVSERLFVDVLNAATRRRVAIVFHVQPAEAGFHRQVMIIRFFGGEPLADEIAAVEDGDQGRVIDAAVQIGDKLAAATDEVRFDF